MHPPTLQASMLVWLADAGAYMDADADAACDNDAPRNPNIPAVLTRSDVRPWRSGLVITIRLH